MYTRLQGSRNITWRIRPPRVAYIVGTVDQCEILAQVCSLTWGGKYFLMVPHDPESGISDEWWRVLVEYDPDEVFTCVELEQRAAQRLSALTAWHASWDKDREHDPIPPWGVDAGGERWVDSNSIRGQSIYTALAGMGTYEDPAKWRKVLVPQFGPYDWYPLELYVKARYGCLNEEHVHSILEKGGLDREYDLERLLPVERISFSDPEGDDFVRYVLDREEVPPYLREHTAEERENPPPLPLIDYTAIGLPAARRRSPLHDEQRYLLIVSGGWDRPSAEDFCWHWALRAQRRSPNGGLPLWLPKVAVERNKGQIAGLFYRGVKGYVLSKSVPVEELRKLASELGEDVEAVTSDLDRFYYKDFVVGEEGRHEVFFSDGKARVPPPKADVIKYCCLKPLGDRYHRSGTPQHYYVDIEVSEYTLPRLRTVVWANEVGVPADRFRVSRTGLSFRRQGFSHEGEHIQLSLPNEWEMLQTYADRAGYTAKLSDKGRMAQRVVDLVGGMDRAWVLSGESVFRLLDRLAELEQRKQIRAYVGKTLAELASPQGADEQAIEDLVARIASQIGSDTHERVHLSYEQMRQILGFKSQKVALGFVGWLSQRRLLFRGTQLECPRCGTKQWLFVDDLGLTMRCVGCQQTVDAPLNVATTHWEYRANTLYAKSHDQGVLPHLLALSYCTTLVGKDVFQPAKTVGQFPGILLEAEQGGKAALPRIEIDIAWLEEEGPVIGECKTVARELKAKEVRDYGKVAEQMGCKRIVLAALLDDFSGVSSEVTSAIEESPVPIDLLTRAELLDQYPFRKSSPGESFEAALAEFLRTASEESA